MTLRMRDRADAYRMAFPNQPAAWPTIVVEDGRHVLYARWLIGAAYGNLTPLYGSYPRGYLSRVLALFPDLARVLHAFSGSLPAKIGTRLDVRPETGAELIGSVYDVKALAGRRMFDLILADPPYSEQDAKHYGTKMINRRRAIAALAEVTRPGGFLVWLDTVWPMHSKRDWVTVGRIALTRSTNHRIRDITIFERTGA